MDIVFWKMLLCPLCANLLWVKTGISVIVYARFLYSKFWNWSSGSKSPAPHTGDMVAKMVKPILWVFYIGAKNFLSMHT